MRVVLIGFSVFAVLSTGAIPAGAQTLQQCPVVVSNTTLTTDCLGPLVVAADGVNVNLDTHQVICASEFTSTTGIDITNRIKVSITNGHVHNCGFALNVQGGGSHMFSNLHLDGNEYDVVFQNTNSNQFTSTVFQNAASAAIELLGSSYNVFDSNLQITDNNAGVFISGGSNNNVVRSSTIENNPVFSVEIASADGNSIIGNSIGLSPAPAVVLESFATHTTVSSNDIFGSDVGIDADAYSRESLIMSNHIHDNTNDGILLSFSSLNQVEENNVMHNGVGIRVEAASSTNTLETNTSLGNATFDLEDDNPNCDANVWTNNNFRTANQPQCIH